MNKYMLVLLLVAVSCQTKDGPDLELEKQKILEMHNLQREHHFNKDSISFADQLSENFISVNRGVISRPERKETIQRYHNYFSSVEFLKWDDLADPIIRFSGDGELAYTIVDKIVEVAYSSENRDSVLEKTQYAWTAIYRKYGDEWKIDCVTSTEEEVTDN